MAPTFKTRGTHGTLQEPSDGNDDSAMLVDFGDAAMVPVAAYTVKEYRIAKQVQYETHKGPLWSMTHPKTGTTLRIVRRRDRTPLLLLQEAGGQICQVSLDAVSENQREAEEKLLPIFKCLAESYASGAVTKENMYEERDKLLKAKFPDISLDKRSRASRTSKEEIKKSSKVKIKKSSKVKIEKNSEVKIEKSSKGDATSTAAASTASCSTHAAASTSTSTAPSNSSGFLEEDQPPVLSMESLMW